MIRTQISLSEEEYQAAKAEAARLGISLAELLRRSLRTVLPVDKSKRGCVLRQYSDQDLKLVDALGIHVMVSRSSQICWSTDFHLGLSGVPLVINSR